MRTATSSLELVRAKSVADALARLRDDPSLTPIAGCTDVYVGVNFGTLESTRFLDLWPLHQLRRISMRDETLVIGALATYTEIIHSRHVRKQLPMLVEASREIGGPQIQNRGTIGGNIANGSPAGDTLPVLAAAEATVVLRSADSERRVDFTSFYRGYRSTERRPDELIVAVEVPRVTGTQWFRKVGTRAAQAISKIVMACVRDDEPRVAIGSVAPTVVRARRAERALARGDIDGGVRALDSDITPIDDVRSTALYRRVVTANLLRRFWADTER